MDLPNHPSVGTYLTVVLHQGSLDLSNSQQTQRVELGPTPKRATCPITSPTPPAWPAGSRSDKPIDPFEPPRTKGWANRRGGWG